MRTLFFLAGLLGVLVFSGCGEPKGDVLNPGLEKNVTARFDELGMLHLDCRSDRDCAAALGYFHARDRFWQMDVRRRFATGRLSSMVGELVLDQADVGNRQLFADREGNFAEERLMEFADEETRELMEAYAQGVNAWLADMREGKNGAKLPRQYDDPLIIDTNIPDWRPEDSFATVLALVNDLTNDSSDQIERGMLHAALEGMPEVYEDFYGVKPLTEATVLDDYPCPDLSRSARRAARDIPRRPHSLTPELLPLFEKALEKARAFKLLRADVENGPEAFGSNNWAVARDLAAGDVAYLSNDPHLAHTQPATWYMAHLDATRGGGAKVAGQTFAGLPWVIIGQNEHIAWGATTTYFDFTDVYIEELSDDGEGVMFKGEKVPFITKELDFEIAGGETRKRTLRWVPHHGPVLSIDRDEGRAITFRWTAHELSTDANVLTKLAKAKTTEEAREALSGFTTIGQNWVVADREGTIGWFPYNRLPVRPWADTYNPNLPLPGDGSAEWENYIPLEALPQLISKSGYVATANNTMTDHLLDGDPTNDCPGIVLQSSSAVGYRQERIRNELDRLAGEHTRETMAALIRDTHSLVGEELKPAILAAVEAEELSPEAEKVRDALAAWQLKCPTGLDGLLPSSDVTSDAEERANAVGCTAMHVALNYIHKAHIGDEQSAWGLGREPSLAVTIRALARPSELERAEGYWDDVRTEDVVESRSEIVARALHEAGAFLSQRLGSDSNGWAWGRIHTITTATDLFSMLAIETYDGRTFANQGGLYTVDVAAPDYERNYINRHGASTRFQCELSDERVDCTYQIPGGQVDDDESPHFEDLMERYLRGEPAPIVLDHDELKEASTLVLSKP